MFNQSFFKCNIKLMCSFFFTVTRGNNLFVIVSFCFVYIKDLSADSRGILIAGYDHSLQLRLMSLNALLVFLSTTSSVLRAWPLISDLSWRPFYYLLFCECFVKHTSGINYVVISLIWELFLIAIMVHIFSFFSFYETRMTLIQKKSIYCKYQFNRLLSTDFYQS